ncbi:hypothetical protein PILCRDRAFT_817178 [Piloderma croceum F 1598]|uniref:Rad21/Rec8-like protein C-terminal eukaryotic domain-containing protein n=1 Tax=Piloderma croceum (strain F 1598) TaxID=765440 RepID=A0A0C3BFY8_PILCF|nr:hypothetical protein PILCRDRAFT_817178 [Piloderma croceum F 1598]
MQFQTLPDSSAFLTFADIVPNATSNPHVASAALYHCLVLGTKDLVRLNQLEAYGPISIIINS